jgi:hypothetical protein
MKALFKSTVVAVVTAQGGEPDIPAIGANRQVTVGCDKPSLRILAPDNSR